MGLSYDQLFPGRFIKAGEMTGKPVTLKIKSVALDVMESEDGTEQMQAVVNFVEIKRQWALNKTNAQCLVAMWGFDSSDWVGKRVTLFAERDTSGMSASGVCLRVAGSPDIDGPVKAEIKLPRRKTVTRTLTKTVKPTAMTDEVTGEVGETSPQTPQDTPRTTSQTGPDADADPDRERWEALSEESGIDPAIDDGMAELDALEEPTPADPITPARAKALRDNMKRLKISLEEWRELLAQYEVESANSLSTEQAAELLTTLDAQTPASWLAQRAMV